MNVLALKSKGTSESKNVLALKSKGTSESNLSASKSVLSKYNYSLPVEHFTNTPAQWTKASCT